MRLRADQSLDDVLGELAHAVWGVLSAHPSMKRLIQPQEQEPLRARLKTVFSRFIVRFDTCGLQVVCEEAVQPAEWNPNPKPELWPTHPWQAQDIRRLMLVVEKRLEEFVDALEAAIFLEMFRTPERAGLAKALRLELADAIRGAIGPHLYRNISCGMSELCRESVKLDPWAAGEKTGVEAE